MRRPRDEQPHTGRSPRRHVDEDEVEAEAERGEQRQAEAGRAAAARSRGSRETSATPTSASRMPAIWSAPGRSPRRDPDRERDHAETAEIGATTPIAPTAIPR